VALGENRVVPDNAFARNNASKLLALPRYLGGDLLSRLVPRRSGSWVVGSALGVNDGARALVVEALSRPEPLRVAWLARSQAEAREARSIGAEVLEHGSWRAFWRALRADVVVVTHGFGDASRFGSRGALVVNLWHGSPLKRMHLDSPAALRLPLLGGIGPVRHLMAAMYRRGTSRIGLMPAGSALVVPRLQGSFGLPEGRVEVLGEPRTDVLFRGGADQRRRAARARLESSVGPVGARRIVLFAPTWRDGRPDPVVPSREEWQAIEAWLAEHGAVLVVRPHPLGIGDYTHTSDAVRLLTSEDEPEVMAVLAAADALVTDFSSVLVDFAVTGGPIVHLAPDEVAYAAEHGLYEPYCETAGGHVERTWTQALQRLTAVFEEGPARAEALAHSAGVAQRFHAHRDGRSAARVVDRILTLTGAQSREEWPRTVFFESFHGRNVACNPAAIDREIARRMPSARRTWSVTDASVTVPDGADAVRRGTPEWFAARDAAELLVLNDWVEDDWRPRRDQFLLQTWHGTPLKRIALGRRGRTPRLFAAVVKQSSRWTAMLAQSESAARLLRRSYAVARPMWVEGYPRNDVIARGDDGGIRQGLGVETPKVALYAPTWRDDALDAPDLLDVADLAGRLGPDWSVLVRGHARTMDVRTQSFGERVLDVTRVPDVSPLLATADVLITDYSSVMFDFSASGRPMVFFVADAEEYSTSTRGFNWDLAARAPGPLVRTTQECAEAVLSATADRERWAARYAAWQAEFNALDDGEASRRVVDRLLSEGARRARPRA
jgi:CDP-glycerol glycerophosphotransferase (TagB/SpsB family)